MLVGVGVGVPVESRTSSPPPPLVASTLPRLVVTLPLLVIALPLPVVALPLPAVALSGPGFALLRRPVPALLRWAPDPPPPSAPWPRRSVGDVDWLCLMVRILLKLNVVRDERNQPTPPSDVSHVVNSKFGEGREAMPVVGWCF